MPSATTKRRPQFEERNPLASLRGDVIVGLERRISPPPKYQQLRLVAQASASSMRKDVPGCSRRAFTTPRGRRRNRFLRGGRAAAGGRCIPTPQRNTSGKRRFASFPASSDLHEDPCPELHPTGAYSPLPPHTFPTRANHVGRGGDTPAHASPDRGLQRRS